MVVSTEASSKKPAMGAQRATIRTISELTGLSPTTVSLALRGGAGVRPATHQRVAEVATKLGYVPDRAGVRLRTGKTNVVALVLERTDETIDFARYLIQGIGRAIAGTPYHMNVTPDFGHADSMASIRYILENRTADGVIITHTGARDRRVQLLMDYDFPFVTHGRTEFYSPHAWHDFHSEEFVRLAVERTAQKGSRKLALLVGRDTTYNYHTIVTAFERTTERYRVDGTVIGASAGPATPVAMRQVGREMARSNPRFDGIICDSELRAMCLIAGLADEGVAVGRDLNLICKQTSDLLATLHPQLDTIEEDVVAAGEELARLLLRRIDGTPPQELRSLGEPKPHWRG